MSNKSYKHMLIQRAEQFSLDILGFVDQIPNSFSFEILGRQLVRSSTSIGANITEAQASLSRRDFTRFMEYALKSAIETIYWLNLLLGSGRIEKTFLHGLLDEGDELARMLGASILKLKGKKL